MNKMQVLIAVQANQVASLHQITKLKFEKRAKVLSRHPPRKVSPPLPSFSTFTLRLKKLDK